MILCFHQVREFLVGFLQSKISVLKNIDLKEEKRFCDITTQFARGGDVTLFLAILSNSNNMVRNDKKAVVKVQDKAALGPKLAHIAGAYPRFLKHEVD